MHLHDSFCYVVKENYSTETIFQLGIYLPFLENEYDGWMGDSPSQTGTPVYGGHLF